VRTALVAFGVSLSLLEKLLGCGQSVLVGLAVQAVRGDMICRASPLELTAVAPALEHGAVRWILVARQLEGGGIVG
jgi:hypothetical protein